MNPATAAKSLKCFDSLLNLTVQTVEGFGSVLKQKREGSSKLSFNLTPTESARSLLAGTKTDTDQNLRNV